MKRADIQAVRGQYSILATAVALALPLLMMPAAPALAQAAGADQAAAQTQQTYRFDIPAKPLPQAIADVSAVTGLQVLYTEQSTFEHMAPALQGRYTVAEALQYLLAGSGLAMRFTGDNSVTIELASEEDVKTLPSVTVMASSSGATTEGVESYTATGPGRSATGLSLTLRETPQSVSVITRQQIEDGNLNDITDVMERTPGVVVDTMGPAGSDSNSIYVRGFAVRSIQVDGVNRSNNYGFREDLADTVTYDRVEVIRGATGLMSGVGDPGATINLIRKKPTRETQRSITLKAGSWDNYRSELDVSSSLSESGHVRGRFVASYQDGQSHIDRQSLERQVAYGILEWDITERTMLTLGAEYQDMDSDEAGNHGFPLFNSDGSHFKPSRSFNSAADWSYHKRDGKILFAGLEHAFDNGWLVKLNAEHSRRSYDDAFATAASGTVNPDGSGISTWSGRWAGEPRQTSFDLSASNGFNLLGREHDLYLGASHYKAYHRSYGYPLWTIQPIDNIHAWDGSLPVPSAIHTRSSVHALDEKQTALLASARWSLSDAASLITGMRVIDWQSDEVSRSLSTGDVSRTGREKNGVVTPYIGLVYDLSDAWSAYASYTTIFNPSDRIDVNGSYLDPEEGKNYELGIKGEWWDKRLTTAFSIFEVRQDNLPVPDGDNPAPDGSQAYRAESGTKTRGFEVEVAGEVLPHLQVAASYTYAVIENADDDRMLAEVPRDTFKLFTSYRIPSLDDLKVGGSVRWQGAEYYQGAGPNGETFRQGDYTLVDLMAQYALTENVTAALNLNNIFDEHYYTSISSRGWYGTPRNATASLRFDF